jgi:peptidoglycan/xylan/chitin deacetylase (PgdA/CDA1 family)
VLCYHQFGQESRKNPYKFSPMRFEAQLQWLKKQGYHSVGLHQLSEAWQGRGTLPAKPVCVTIDDGFESGWTVAGPILKKEGFKAAYFLQAKLQGRRTMLSWEEIREMEKEGFEVGSHTCFHSNLGRPDKQESPESYRRRLHEEIFESKKILEGKLGHPVDWLAYPYGAYNPWVEKQVEQAGYRWALSVTKGLNTGATPRFKLHRFLIMGPPSPQAFARSLDFQTLPVSVEGVQEGGAWESGQERPLKFHAENGYQPRHLEACVEKTHLNLDHPLIPASLPAGFHFLALKDGSRQEQILFQVRKPEWKDYQP